MTVESMWPPKICKSCGKPMKSDPNSPADNMEDDNKCECQTCQDKAQIATVTNAMKSVNVAYCQGVEKGVELTEAVKNKAHHLAEAAVQAAADGVVSAKDIAEKKAGEVYGKAVEVAGVGAKLTQEKAQELYGQSVQVVGASVQTAQTKANELYGTTVQTVGAVQNKATELVGQSIQAVGAVQNKANEVYGTTVQTVQSKAQEAYGATVQAAAKAQELYGTTVQTVGSVQNKAQEVYGTTVNAVGAAQTKAQEVYGTTLETVNSYKETLQKEAPGVYSVAEATVTGAWGILSAATKMVADNLQQQQKKEEPKPSDPK